MYNFSFSCTKANTNELTESFGSTLPQTLQARKETQFKHKVNYILMLDSVLGDVNVEHQHYTGHKFGSAVTISTFHKSNWLKCTEKHLEDCRNHMQPT